MSLSVFYLLEDYCEDFFIAFVVWIKQGQGRGLTLGEGAGRGLFRGGNTAVYLTWAKAFNQLSSGVTCLQGQRADS